MGCGAGKGDGGWGLSAGPPVITTHNWLVLGLASELRGLLGYLGRRASRCRSQPRDRRSTCPAPAALCSLGLEARKESIWQAVTAAAEGVGGAPRLLALCLPSLP